MINDPQVTATPIPGLLVIGLPIHDDPRGWFKENWQREKMVALGLPDFQPVQHNVSYNAEAGVTRGIHAEPWDKLVSVLAGKVFGAWVDLREGDTFGRIVTAEIGLGQTVFVPRGVGNAYQALAGDTIYSYLVNEHWSPQARDRYTMVNAADPDLGIEWPIPLERAHRSSSDLTHPSLDAVTPIKPRRTIILGPDGQLGSALRKELPHADILSRAEFDLTEFGTREVGDPQASGRFDWSGVDTIINAAAYTAVDAAETDRATAWATNVSGVAALTQIARAQRATLVQISSDYVFDGTKSEPWTETDPMAPLSYYGITKAAADEVVATWANHYIVRTSWLIGDGKNFVTTMRSLAEQGHRPSVVDDQIGRITFASTLAAAIRHLLDSGAPYGTYNVTNAGPATSWADVAADVYQLSGRDRADVSPVSTADYLKDADLDNRIRRAPRPANSTLDLGKITASGFEPRDARSCLREYLT